MTAFSRGKRIGLMVMLCALPMLAAADYLTPDLRFRVDQLKRTMDSIPTDAYNASQRAELTWDWINAWALSGGYVPVNATQIVAVVLGGTTGPRALRALDLTIRELQYLDDNPRGLGTLTADTGPFTAGEFATITQTYRVGETAIQNGGSFLLARHFMANFGAWQTNDPKAANYVTIQSSNPRVSFAATTTPLAGMHGGFRSERASLTFRVASGTLVPGDEVTITWGDTRGGGPGMKMPTISSDRMPLPIYITPNRTSQLLSLPIQPIRIQGADTAGVAGFAPSVLDVGEPFEFSVRAQDAFYNRATGTIPNWRVKLNGELWQSIDQPDPITVGQASFDAPGIYYLTVESEDGAVSGRFNPILVEAAPARRIYWGDTHGHSGFAEGIGTPDRFMRWAKEDARLDFVTHSEHDVWMDDHEWQVLKDNVIRFTEEGRFIAYLGYEWTIYGPRGGHHNVLFRTPKDRVRVPAQFYPTLSRLYAGLRATADPEDVVVIPHAHQAGDYRQSDPELEPLVEIMSQHGSFEWFGRMYLKHGHRVGFTAASDNHLSQPGYSAPLGGSLSQKGGLGAVLASERTTDAIFDGMKALRAYATTGDRIILDFSLNEGTMGERVGFAERRAIKVRAIGTAPIKSVTLFKNDDVLKQELYLDHETRNTQENELILTFASDSVPIHPGDNPRGWRSWEGTMEVSGAKLAGLIPIDSGFPADARIEGDVAKFATKTRGDTSSFRLRLKEVSRNARVTLHLLETRETGGAPPIYRPQQRIPAVSLTLNVKDLAEGRAEQSQAVDDYVDRVWLTRQQRGGTKVVEFETTDTGSRQGDYYFVRVRQVDDAMAWSSPIWVGGHDPQ